MQQNLGTLELLDKVVDENLYQNLIIQLNKDFQLSNVNERFDLLCESNQLKNTLATVLLKLITKQYDDYLNLLYRIDVSEKELLTVKSNDLEVIVEQITYIILKREYQKVWFKNKF